MHRIFRNIVGDKTAVLLWDAPGWSREPDTGKWLDGDYCIDGPAVEVLRDILGVANRRSG